MSKKPEASCSFDGDPVNQCWRKAWRDGLCAAHHPEGVKCLATTGSGANCKNWAWKDGLCRNHNRQRRIIEEGRCSGTNAAGRQCKNFAARDGFCETHHPETVARQQKHHNEYAIRELKAEREEVYRVSHRAEPAIRTKVEAYVVAMPPDGGNFAAYKVFVLSCSRASISWSWLELLAGDPYSTNLYSYSEQMQETLDEIRESRWTELEDNGIRIFQSISDMEQAIRDYFDGICDLVLGNLGDLSIRT